MLFNQISKQSIESNSADLQNNEANALQELKTRNYQIIRVIPLIDAPRKIKYFYSNPGLSSYSRRSSQKPNNAFEKTDTIKVDTPQLSEIYITNVQKIDNMTGPRTFESVIEKNILNMPPVIEKEFTPKIIRTFEKIGKNNELNFIQNKATNREIDIPIPPTISNKTILKRM
jgi:hypothetical protein